MQRIRAFFGVAAASLAAFTLTVPSYAQDSSADASCILSIQNDIFNGQSDPNDPNVTNFKVADLSYTIRKTTEGVALEMAMPSNDTLRLLNNQYFARFQEEAEFKPFPREYLPKQTVQLMESMYLQIASVRDICNTNGVLETGSTKLPRRN